MKHFIHSEPGEGHRNEDAVLVRTHSHKGGILVCALADGQGGQSGGGPAAHLAVEESVTAAVGSSLQKLWDAASWYVYVGDADTAVVEADDAGFTTLVALTVDGRKVQGASCGDSSALLIQEGAAKWLTEGQRKNPPIGSGEAFPVVFEADLHTPWKLLMMSDGVWRYVSDEALTRIATGYDGGELTAALRQAALDGNSGRLGDDFTVVLVQPD